MENRLFALRLSALRQQKGVSAREMSLALGQNTNYINRIENGRNYPSMQSFFYIANCNNKLSIQLARSLLFEEDPAQLRREP